MGATVNKDRSSHPSQTHTIKLDANYTYVEDAIRDFSNALRANSLDDREFLTSLISTCNLVVEMHKNKPSYLVLDDILILKSLVVRCKIPREDEVLGKTDALQQLRSARGSLLAELDDLLHDASSPMLDNADLSNRGVNRSDYTRELRALEERLRRTEQILIEQIAPEKQKSSRQQYSLVSFYVNTMSIELALAKLEIAAKGILDFELLAKLINNMGELTADFASTLAGLRDKVTESLKNAAQSIRKPIGRAAKTLSMLVRREVRKAATSPVSPHDSQTPADKNESLQERQADKFADQVSELTKEEQQHSLAQSIAQFIPYLRRFARLIVADHTKGDALVLQTLERIIARRASVDENHNDKARTALYRLFLEVYAEEFDDYAQLGDNRLNRLSYNSRIAFLLNSVEGFSIQEIALTMSASISEVNDFLKIAADEISESIRTDILIVEDEPFIAHDLQTIVEELGHRVVGIAATRNEAVDLFNSHSPRLVLVDIILKDGSSGLEAVNSMLKNSSAAIIFVTAQPQRFLTESPPAESFLITKPFAVESLKATISQVLFFDRICPKSQ